MNVKMLLNLLGKTLMIMAGLMIIPLIVGIIYAENNFINFLIPILILLLIGTPLSFLKYQDNAIYAKEGFVIVSLAWILLSLVGCLPFIISGEIPNFFDAFFETVSGFTTTGSSVLSGEQIESMSKANMFWRVFTHWIGGMGILVFVLAIIPEGNRGVMHVYSSESPGPSSSKLVSKIRNTTRILYLIYIAMSILQAIFLLCGGMNFYESLITVFSTAGTGGFSMFSDGFMHYANIAHPSAVYFEMVTAVFMFLFGVNFNVYYLIITGNLIKGLKSEELRAYLIITITTTLIIALNILSMVDNFGQAIRYSLFQVTSIQSTTGMSTATFENWPVVSKTILVFLMILGACGGSTGGGMKVSRGLILAKSTGQDIKKMLHPRAMTSFRVEGEIVPKEVEKSAKTYFVLWFIIVVVVTLLLSIDGYAISQGDDGIMTNLTATLSCIGNIGPGMTKVIGSMGSFGGYTWFSKIILSFVMLAGRLEILPLFILFSPSTWKRGK